LEKFIERTLFASRWLLAPMYLGLSLALVTLSIKFFIELSYDLCFFGRVARCAGPDDRTGPCP
jgi:uncharacterized protein (TIGR00645 family)